METRLHQALRRQSQPGSSSRSDRTCSSSSKLVRSPSPRRALRLILSGDKFLTNLREGDGRQQAFLWALEGPDEESYLERCFTMVFLMMDVILLTRT